MLCSLIPCFTRWISSQELGATKKETRHRAKWIVSFAILILQIHLCSVSNAINYAPPAFFMKLGNSYCEMEEFLRLDEKRALSSVEVHFAHQNKKSEFRAKDLPPELLKKLASFETIEDLIFQGLGENSTDQGALDLSGLDKLRNVRRVSLRWVKLDSSSFSSEVSLPHLKEIKIESCDLEQGFLRVLRERAQLESLIIDDYVVPPGELNSLPQLKALVLRNVRAIDGADGRLFEEVLQLPKLESLAFESVDGAKALRVAGKMPQLKSLAIREAGIDDAMLVLLGTNNMLNSLDLAANSIQGVGLSALHKDVTLRILKLADNPITDEGLARIAGFEELVELDLHNKNAGSDILGDEHDRMRVKQEIESMHRTGKFNIYFGPVHTASGFEQLKVLKNLQRLRLRDFSEQTGGSGGRNTESSDGYNTSEQLRKQFSVQELAVIERMPSLQEVNGRPFKRRSTLNRHLDDAARLEGQGKYEESLSALELCTAATQDGAASKSYVALQKARILELLGRHEAVQTEVEKIRVADLDGTEDDKVSCKVNGKFYYCPVDQVYSLLLRNRFYDEALLLTEGRYAGYGNEANAILRKAMVRLNEGRFRESEQLLESVFEQLDKESTRWGEGFDDPIFFRAVCQLKWLYLASSRYEEANQLWLLPYDRLFAAGTLAFEEKTRWQNLNRHRALAFTGDPAQQKQTPHSTESSALKSSGGSQKLQKSVMKAMSNLAAAAGAGDESIQTPNSTDSVALTKSISLFNANMNRVALYNLIRFDLADQQQMILLAHQGRTNEAIAVSDEITRRDYTNSKATLPKLGDLTFSALFLRNRAVILRATGQLAESEKCLRESIRLLNSRYGMDFAETVITLEILSRVLAEQDKLVEAEQSYGEAIVRSASSYGSQHPHTAELLQQLAQVQIGLGKTDKAVANIDQSRRIIRDYVGGVLTNLPEHEQDRFLTTAYTPMFYSSIELAGADQKGFVPESMSLEWVLNGKAVAAETRASLLVRLRENRQPSLMKLSEEISALRQQRISIEVAALRSGENIKPNETANLTSKEDQLFHELVGKSMVQDKKGNLDRPRWTTTKNVVDALSNQEALVEVVRYRKQPDSEAHSGSDEQFRYQAWILLKSGNPTIVDLGPANEIDRLVAQVRRSLSESPNTVAEVGEIEAEKLIRGELKALADKILSPMLPVIGASEIWTICPDGNLWLIPWAALPTSESEYAIEKHTLRYLVSGRELVVKNRDTNGLTAPVVVADPDFDLPARGQSVPTLDKSVVEGLTISRTSRILNGTRVSSLPGTAAEARAAVGRFESIYGEAPTVLMGDKATSNSFRAIKRPIAVLMSTHGFFLESAPHATGGSQVHRSDNPLLRCGLLFAGCNQQVSAPKDDIGVLTGLDIVSMDLTGTELVVLSACDTGLGDVQNGEGVAGLRQAFQLAGAELIAATLWQIPDLESAQVMERFFEELERTFDPTISMRNAQVRMIQELRRKQGAAHPYFWSAYTITGNSVVKTKQ